MTETFTLQDAQTQEAAQINAIKITHRGVRAVKMTDIAGGGEARAELLRLLAQKMDDTLQLLYVLPTEDEAIALKSFCDQALIEKYTLDLVEDNFTASKMMFTTYRGLRVLLKQGALPHKLLLVLDPSFMPLTVDMEIATGLAWDWADILRAEDLEAKPSSTAETIKITLFCMTSAYQKCNYIIPWMDLDSMDTAVINNFGCRPNTFSLTRSMTTGNVPFRNALVQFRNDVVSHCADSQQTQSGNTDSGVGPSKVLLCIMSAEMFYSGLKSLPAQELAELEHINVPYIADFIKQPHDRQTTAHRSADQINDCKGSIIILDPRVGIMHAMPSVTHAFIANMIQMPLYDQMLRRATYPSLIHKTKGQLRQHFELLTGSRTKSLCSVYAAVGVHDGEDCVELRAVWSPSIAKDLTILLLEAHITWPAQTLQMMPIETLPDPAAVAESMRRLSWYGCTTEDGVLSPGISPKLGKLLQHLPNFNLAMLLSGIELLDTSPRLARVIVQMALIIHHEPENLLKYVEEGDRMEVDDTETDPDTSIDILEPLDALNQLQLGSTECARKGLLFRAWACMTSAMRIGRYKKVDKDCDVSIWEKVVDGFELNLNVVHKIVDEAKVIGKIMGIDQAHAPVSRLSCEEVLELETHLVRAYYFELAIFTTPSEDNVYRACACDIVSNQLLKYEQRKTDLFFTPPERDELTGDVRYVIVFKVGRLSDDHQAEMLSELFISTRAIGRAIRHFQQHSPMAKGKTAIEVFNSITP